jgi:hypothetical protein
MGCTHSLQPCMEAPQPRPHGLLLLLPPHKPPQSIPLLPLPPLHLPPLHLHPLHLPPLQYPQPLTLLLVPRLPFQETQAPPHCCSSSSGCPTFGVGGMAREGGRSSLL